MRHPQRQEIGVAEDTMAAMQPSGSKNRPSEIWVMWTRSKKTSLQNEKFDFGSQIIISTWRYPGISPQHEPPPIPDDVWQVLEKVKNRP